MKSQFLSTMGIQVWQSRYPLPGAKAEVHYQILQLLNRENDFSGYLLLDTGLNLTNSGKKVYHLLEAMLHAVGLHYSQVPSSTANVFAEGSKKILIMGESLAEKLLPTTTDIPILVTLHPLELLSQPAKKRKAWLDLQIFIKH